MHIWKVKAKNFIFYLIENPNLVITLNGYQSPDESKGIDSKRAKLIRKQLIASGIEKERVFVTKYKDNQHNIDFPKSCVTIRVIGTDFQK